MLFNLFECCIMWNTSFKQSFMQISLLKLSTYQGKNRSLLMFGYAEGQPVMDLFWVRFLSYIPTEDEL